MAKSFREVNGCFLLDKPIGMSSNQALQIVKKLFQAKKAGHTGTLDVLASGMLPICFGEATKFANFLLDSNKSYYVEAKLGEKTATCDAEGEVIDTRPTSHVTETLVIETLQKFIGDIYQTPSMYSALKHKGQPLYKLARAGIEVERQPRKIHIESIELIDYKENHFALKVSCSKGTYIRNLVDDIGEQLQCGAYVTMLRRLSASHFKEQEMITLENIQMLCSQDCLAVIDKYLLPINEMISHLKTLNLSVDEVKFVQRGLSIQTQSSDFGEVRLIDQSGRFIGIGEVDSTGQLFPRRMMAS